MNQPNQIDQKDLGDRIESRVKRSARFGMLCLALFVIWMLQQLISPGFTAKGTAEILIRDHKFGMRAIEVAVWRGNSMLPVLAEVSEDYAKLNGRNAAWVAEVLGRIETPESVAVLRELSTRPELHAKLVGVNGLARQGASLDPAADRVFLIHQIETGRNYSDAWAIELSVDALGWLGDPEALATLHELLRLRKAGASAQDKACLALQRIGSTESIPVLRDGMRSNDFYATHAAMLALLGLGDREALALAFERIEPEGTGWHADQLVEELEDITGQSLGHDQVAWRAWWESVQDTWQIPAEFVGPPND